MTPPNATGTPRIPGPAALPVVGEKHRVVGIVELGALATAAPDGLVEALMDDAVAVPVVEALARGLFLPALSGQAEAAA